MSGLLVFLMRLAWIPCYFTHKMWIQLVISLLRKRSTFCIIKLFERMHISRLQRIDMDDWITRSCRHHFIIRGNILSRVWRSTSCACEFQFNPPRCFFLLSTSIFPHAPTLFLQAPLDLLFGSCEIIHQHFLRKISMFNESSEKLLDISSVN